VSLRTATPRACSNLSRIGPRPNGGDSRYHPVLPSGTLDLPITSKLFPTALLVCNVGAAICSALSGDYRRSIYWAASALCIGAITY
jgi:hypothetical protein